MQQAAFNKEKLQHNLEYVIKQIAAVYALRNKNFKNKDKPDFEETDIREIFKQIDQTDTKIDYDLFSQEFQVAVLGIGKRVAQGGRYGEPAPSQHWSFPSNDTANKEFTKVFGTAMMESCDVHITKKPIEMKLNKGKKTLLLKQQVIDDLKK